jgi:hypothetical protein
MKGSIEVRDFETETQPAADGVVSFTPFHFHRFSLPSHLFLWGLLLHYGLRLHDQTLVGILQGSTSRSL